MHIFEGESSQSDQGFVGAIVAGRFRVVLGKRGRADWSQNWS